MSNTPLTDAEIARILAAPMNHADRFAALAEFAESLERKIGRMQKIGDEMEQWVIRPHDAWAEEKKNQP